MAESRRKRRQRQALQGPPQAGKLERRRARSRAQRPYSLQWDTWLLLGANPARVLMPGWAWQGTATLE